MNRVHASGSMSTIYGFSKNEHMKITNLTAIASLLLLTSCSPRVITSIVKTYPDMIPADSVYVIGLGEKVPNTAETIGRVSVVDRGTSTNCNYDQVLHLAQVATGKSGGNGLALTNHEKPSFWGSSCHQISGLMLRLSDKDVDTLRTNPVQDMIDLDLEVARQIRADRKLPANNFEFNIGYGWVTSQLYDAYGNSAGSKGGMDWKIGYQYIWSSGWGIGVNYFGSKTSFEVGDIQLSYIAPECAWGMKSGKWIFKGGLGVGLFLYNDPGYKTSGLGVHASIGLEYMLSDHWGIGISANTMNASLPKQNNFELKDNEHSGITRFNLLGGLRWYF